MLVIIFPSQTVVTVMGWVLEPVMEAQPKRGVMQSKTDQNFMTALSKNIVGLDAIAASASYSTISILICVENVNISSDEELKGYKIRTIAA